MGLQIDHHYISRSKRMKVNPVAVTAEKKSIPTSYFLSWVWHVYWPWYNASPSIFVYTRVRVPRCLSTSTRLGLLGYPDQ